MDLREAMRLTGAGSRGSRVRANDLFVFDGGLNLVDPPINVSPGQLIGVKNYEPGVRGGYSRIDGYERFDGRASPTAADYWALTVTDVVGDPWIIGDRLRQYATGETVFNSTTLTADGIIVFKQDEGAGVWTVAVIRTDDTPDFADGFIPVGDVYTSPIATGHPGTFAGPNSSAYQNGADNDTTDALVRYTKTEYMRAFITPVGGGACSGPVLGVAVFRERVVAWRNNAAGTETTMWETNNDPFDGWQQVNLGLKIRFDRGSLEVAEGVTINGESSGATAVVRRIVSDDGTFGSGDAAGYIITGEIIGVFAASENIRVLTNPVARFLSSSVQTLPPNGKYRTRVNNFYGAQDRRYLYGVSGVTNAFEYDGTTFTLIETGMVIDKPTHLFVLNNHLGLCYPGGSIQTSGFQRPLNWNPVLGADERSVGADVTDVIEETNRTVFLGTRQNTWVYYGDTVENFQLRLYASETGIIRDTAGRLGQTIYLDDHGFTSLRHTQAFGNFATNSISDKILPMVQNLVGTKDIVGAVISRRKNLYRCFFEDGTGLVVSSRPGNKISGWTQVKYLANPTCFASSEVEGTVGLIDGQKPEPGPIFPERLFMGADNGYVYEMDVGNSFDGSVIEHFARFVYHHTRSPEVFKHYRKATIDVNVTGLTTLFATVDFNYGNRSGQAGTEIEFLGGGGLWDISNWDEFNWSGQLFDQISMKVEGDGFNIGLFFYGSSDRETSHTLFNVTYHYSMRRINRGTP